jgi:hypothetical protein
MPEFSATYPRVTDDTMSQCEEDVDVIPIYIEVCQRPTSTASSAEVQSYVRKVLQSRSFRYSPGVLEMPGDDVFLDRHVENVVMTDTNDARVSSGSRLLFWQVGDPSCSVPC